jgi:hypothetical protein
MKQLILLLAILFSLGVVAYYLYVRNSEKSSNIDMPERNFSVADIQDVHKIFLAYKDRDPVTFVRSASGWIINDSVQADESVMIHMTNVLQNIKMLYIPPKPSTKTIAQSIGKNGIKVELYDKKDKNIKVFYIGTDTQAGDGTHMIMEGASQPYVMHLPGLLGGLRSRFEQPIRNYRDKSVFRYNPDDIREISLFYPKDINASFRLKKEGGNYLVEPLDPLTTRIKKAVSTSRVRAYLDGFEWVAAEAIVNENEARDSILRLIPFCKMTVKDKADNIKEADFYSYDEIVIKDVKTRSVSDIAAIDRFFVQVKGGDFYIVQRRVFEKVLPSYQYFFATPEVQLQKK